MDVSGKIRFELSISGRDDGTLEAVYISLRPGKVRKTQEVKRNALLADYDEHGNIIGIEILAPVRLSKITSLAEQPLRGSFRKFVKKSVPADLVLA